MDLKIFSSKRVYFKWRTEPPTITQPRRSRNFFFGDIELFLDLEAKYDQVFNLMVNVYVVGNVVWNMSLRSRGGDHVASSIVLNDLQMTVYVQGRSGSLDHVGFKTRDSDLVWTAYESKILHQRNDFVVDGLLTFVFVFDMPLRMISELETKSESDRRTNHPSCQDQLAEDLKKILDDPEHRDVLMVCDDQKTFGAHRCVLAARSEVFAAMFRSNMVERNSGVVHVRDVESSVFRQLLEYVYSGRTDDLTAESAIPLYEAADKYSVQSLRRKCVSVLRRNISVENIQAVFQMAERFADSELMEAAVSFVAEKRQFLRSEEWRTFAEQHPAIGTKVYERAIDLLTS